MWATTPGSLRPPCHPNGASSSAKGPRSHQRNTDAEPGPIIPGRTPTFVSEDKYLFSESEYPESPVIQLWRNLHQEGYLEDAPASADGVNTGAFIGPLYDDTPAVGGKSQTATLKKHFHPPSETLESLNGDLSKGRC